MRADPLQQILGLALIVVGAWLAAGAATALIVAGAVLYVDVTAKKVLDLVSHRGSTGKG